MKTSLKIQSVFQQQAATYNKVVAGSVGTMYVRIYDCMLFMRLFL